MNGYGGMRASASEIVIAIAIAIEKPEPRGLSVRLSVCFTAQPKGVASGKFQVSSSWDQRLAGDSFALPVHRFRRLEGCGPSRRFAAQVIGFR